jgi:hypothetical protein
MVLMAIMKFKKELIERKEVVARGIGTHRAINILR